jgi:FixJ family two-component response regulator
MEEGDSCIAVQMDGYQGEELTESKPAVILVEDDPSVLRALRRLIVSFGFEVWTFTRPSELQAITIPDFDTCLMFDVHLPEMSGVELYEKLSAAGCRLPVIVITGHDDDSTLLMIARINAVAVLIKPFSRDVLLAAIAKALALSAHLP